MEARRGSPATDNLPGYPRVTTDQCSQHPGREYPGGRRGARRRSACRADRGSPAVEPDRVEQVVNSIVRRLESTGESDVTADLVGELIMEALASLDKVAYVRFASVYRNFREAKDFEEFITDELGAEGNR